MDEMPPRNCPSDWLEALDRAEADVAAGRVVDGAEIHAELAASIERMKRRKANANRSRTRQHR